MSNGIPPTPPVAVAAFYCFARMGDPAGLAGRLRADGASAGLKGTIILATEGVNGTIAGAPAAVEAMLALLRAQPGCAAMPAKLHAAETLPFARWKVKVKAEIVTMGVPQIDATRPGHHVAPQQWNALISEPDVILIDARNSYEVAVGSFPGALDPGTRSFGDFPAWFDGQAARWSAEGRNPRLAMFCTGGIRCEKSTALARARGFDQVYHLEGGILAYLAAIEEKESLWQGDCFLFDERVSLTHGLAQGGQALCGECGQPVAPDGQCGCAPEM